MKVIFILILSLIIHYLVSNRNNKENKETFHGSMIQLYANNPYFNPYNYPYNNIYSYPYNNVYSYPYNMWNSPIYPLRRWRRIPYYYY